MATRKKAKKKPAQKKRTKKAAAKKKVARKAAGKATAKNTRGKKKAGGQQTAKTASKKITKKKTVSKRSAAKQASAKTTSKRNENKTVATSADVDRFLDSVDEKYREDCRELADMMGKITRCDPKMWGASIVGFGTYHYKYASGREGDFMITGFAPRKTSLTLYIMTGFDDAPELMESLGTYKTGKSCLYVKKLDDVHRPTLRKLIRKSVSAMKKKYPTS